MKATFTMHVEFIDLAASERATVQARGQAPGSAVDMTNTPQQVLACIKQKLERAA